MKSITKTKLSKNEIQDLVKHSLGCHLTIGEIVELKEGLFNAAYSVEIVEENKEVILKVSPSSSVDLLTYEQDSMGTEIEVYKLLAAHTDIPMPELLAYNLDKDVIDCNYMFISKLEGTSLLKVKSKLTREENDEIKRIQGEYCAQINSIQGDYFGYFTDQEAKQFTSWKKAFLTMITNVLQDGQKRDVYLPSGYDEIYKIFEQKSKLLDAITQPKLVNYDLWDGNILLKQKNNQYFVEGIIDFERAFWGDPYADFVSALPLRNDVRKEVAFLEGYSNQIGEKIQITDEDICRIAMYRAYLYLLSIIEAYRYDDDYRIPKQNGMSMLLKKCLKRIQKTSKDLIGIDPFI